MIADDPPYPQIFSEAFRILRPGGTIALVDMDPSAPGYVKLRKNPASEQTACGANDDDDDTKILGLVQLFLGSLSVF